MRGNFKFYRDDKGFGFITSDEGEDHFVHVKDISNAGSVAILKGQRVEFEPHRTEKGRCAKNARLID